MSGASNVAIAQLTSKSGGAVSLRSVHMEGRLEGLLLSMKTRQHYLNTSNKNVETVYTFPLPWGANLLGLVAEIDGHRLEGTVMEKNVAVSRYEEAIEDGDTPIMVERSSRGLFTANLGNLKPGESAVIEIEYAQLLRFEQGQIRITIPTTVAARFGDGHEKRELAPHQSVETDMLVEYPFTAKLTITGELSNAALDSPTHEIVLSKDDHSAVVTLTQNGYLDRDFVLLLERLKGQSIATCVSDGEHVIALASFCPMLKSTVQEHLLLKVLVDCSGSMGGESITSARNALHELLKELEPQDQISYSRFGSGVVHDTISFVPCTDSNIAAVSSLVSRTEADMGGTALNEALLSTFRLGVVSSNKGAIQFSPEGLTADVLLITDGALWGIDEMVQSAQASGHRIFAIGVGSAPAESLLRELAEKTGGACELISPNQAMATVVLRMINRMRSPQSKELAVDWGQEPVWQSQLPTRMFGGETLHVFAQLSIKPSRNPTLSYQDGDSVLDVSAAFPAVTKNALLARMAGAAQFEETAMPPEQSQVRGEALASKRLEIALNHQLVTDMTNLVLVHVRDGEKKATGLPALEQIAQMHAAGWGGVGNSHRKYAPASALGPLESRAGTIRGFNSGNDLFLSVSTVDSPRFLHLDSAPPVQRKKVAVLNAADLKRRVANIPAKPISILESFESAVMDSRMVGAAFVTEYLAKFPMKAILLVNAMTEQLKSRNQAMSLLILWLADELASQSVLTGQARRILRHSLRSVPTEAIAAMKAQLNQEVGIPCFDSWGMADTFDVLAEADGSSL